MLANFAPLEVRLVPAPSEARRVRRRGPLIRRSLLAGAAVDDQFLNHSQRPGREYQLAMLAELGTIAIIVLLIALAIWASRSDGSSGNVDNRSSANYYGGG